MAHMALVGIQNSHEKSAIEGNQQRVYDGQDSAHGACFVNLPGWAFLKNKLRNNIL
jgi:hypothetical protein